jgi:hypothetical protein
MRPNPTSHYIPLTIRRHRARMPDATSLYTQSRRKEFAATDGQVEYAVFITNYDDSPAMGVVPRYSERWDIENQYDSNKRLLSPATTRNYGCESHFLFLDAPGHCLPSVKRWRNFLEVQFDTESDEVGRGFGSRDSVWLSRYIVERPRSTVFITERNCKVVSFQSRLLCL